MPISVKDIQEKIFPTQSSGGYDVEQVDDFLDEISDQLETLIRENLLLKGQVGKMEEQLSAKDAALKEAISKTPDFNEEGYFRNLQSAMRDSLISAQRLADETTASAKSEADLLVSDARCQAQHMVDDARAESEKIVADAKDEAAATVKNARDAADAAKEELASLKSSVENYRSTFRRLVDEQYQVLKNYDCSFK